LKRIVSLTVSVLLFLTLVSSAAHAIGANLVLGQTISSSIFHDGIQREYILYIPGSYSPDTAVPLVINLHGYTSSAQSQMESGDFRSIADTAGFLIVHPLGTDDILGNPHWNNAGNANDADDIGFIEALIDALAAEYNIDNNRVYSTGYSNGGYMSYTLACQLSHRIRAVASVAGQMYNGQFESCIPSRPVPVMEIHGTADPVIPYGGGVLGEPTADVISFWSGFNNCSPNPVVTDMPNINTDDGSTTERQVFTNCDESIEVEHYKINNGGHTWPGTTHSYPFYYGWTNHDIDASAEIWRFFSQYGYPAVNPCHPLVLGKTGSGDPPTVVPANSEGCSDGEYVEGETIGLTAHPAEGHHVSGWTGTVNDASASLTNQVIMPASSHNILTHYEKDPQACHALTLGYIGIGELPTASPANSEKCSIGEYLERETINLTAHPADGYHVSGWTGTADDSSASLANQVIMPAEGHEVATLYEEDSLIYLPIITKE